MKAKMKTIISASRRTDLPAFYYTWLQDALLRGRIELSNPRFPEKTYSVDLRPENVHSIVLWSKDFSKVLKNPLHLENYNLYFQYTINGYSRALEPYAPAYRETINVLDGLLKRYRPEQFNIRFDPIIISAGGEVEPDWAKPGSARLKVFETLCNNLISLGMRKCRVTTSFVDLYSHVKQRMEQLDIKFINLDERLQAMFAGRMAEIADKYGIMLYSCASPINGIASGRCIDGELLERLFGGRVSKARDAGQRKTCNCCKSSDIGRYDQICRFSCVYCYACK